MLKYGLNLQFTCIRDFIKINIIRNQPRMDRYYVMISKISKFRISIWFFFYTFDSLKVSLHHCFNYIYIRQKFYYNSCPNYILYVV